MSDNKKIPVRYVMQCGCNLWLDELKKTHAYFCPEHGAMIDHLICTCEKCGVEVLRFRQKKGNRMTFSHVKYCDACREAMRHPIHKPGEYNRPPIDNDRQRDESRSDCIHYISECLMKYASYTSVPCKACKRYQQAVFEIDPLAVKFDYSTVSVYYDIG
ncbi:hypothetical protein [Desulfobacter postgatei]|uniref:hypothetical protein n=1 Tax=Desulfobacter postgatei TaxID=2293 RepID=UPI002FDB186C